MPRTVGQVRVHSSRRPRSVTLTLHPPRGLLDVNCGTKSALLFVVVRLEHRPDDQQNHHLRHPVANGQDVPRPRLRYTQIVSSSGEGAEFRGEADRTRHASVTADAGCCLDCDRAVCEPGKKYKPCHLCYGSQLPVAHHDLADPLIPQMTPLWGRLACSASQVSVELQSRLFSIGCVGEHVQ